MWADFKIQGAVGDSQGNAISRSGRSCKREPTMICRQISTIWRWNAILMPPGRCRVEGPQFFLVLYADSVYMSLSSDRWHPMEWCPALPILIGFFKARESTLLACRRGGGWWEGAEWKGWWGNGPGGGEDGSTTHWNVGMEEFQSVARHITPHTQHDWIRWTHILPLCFCLYLFICVCICVYVYIPA